MPKHSIEDLENIYKESHSVDKAIFAEMRSNLLLVAGEHYNRRKRKYFVNRIRESRGLTDEQKLRLVKNHISKISNMYVNNIVSGSPGVAVVPDRDNEVQDQKSAELHGAVWKFGKEEYKVTEKIRDWAQDFVDIGECAVKIYWDPYKGHLVGYEQAVDPLTGEPLFEPGQMAVDEFGQPILDEMGMPVIQQGAPIPDKERPIFSGAFCFDRLFGFDLFRDPNVTDMEDSPFLGYRKMTSVKDLKARYKEDEQKLKMIEQSEDDTYSVFDNNTYEYSRSKEMVMVKEYYFKPSIEYPNGYFYITVPNGILEEGELPFGVFPIKMKAFDKFQKTPRGRSKIKQLRPYQIEINRCASAIATHQVTLGDDKLVGNTIGKLEHGGIIPGVRFIKTNSVGDLKILPGRSGEQYLGYMQQQISEMYDIANLREEAMEETQVSDPFLNLFRSIKQKKKFSLYVERFSEFLVDVAETYLELAKHYLPDDMLIPAISKKEFINIAEYRSAEKLGYRIDIEPRSDDIETLMGKQLVMNHTLQYAGGQMDREDLGKIIKNMPLANMDESFSDLTIDYDIAKNTILQIERGEMPSRLYEGNPDYILKKLYHRTQEADFEFLEPQIQQAFMEVLQAYQQLKAQQQLEMQRAQSGYIPTGGYMVKADFYVSTEDGKTKRATLPYEAVAWLIQQLEAQGASQAELEKMQAGNMANIASMMNMAQPG